jgi:hypothetical protein
MKSLLLLLALAATALAGPRVKFGDDRYSLAFPEGWKKADAPNEKALVPHQNADGSALFAVNLLPVPKDAKPDLEGTAKDLAAQLAKSLGLKDDPEIQEGELDGLPARFVTMVPAKKGDDEAQLGMILVLIEGKTEVVVLQSTITVPAKQATREACLAIITSFKREDLEKQEK